MAINEFLNRLHPFKDELPENYAKVMMDFCGSCIINEPEANFTHDLYAIKWAGRGDYKPFLRMVELGV